MDFVRQAVQSGWMMLASLFLLLGIGLFAREGLLSPPDLAQSLTLSFIWWSSLIVGVIGIVLAGRDFTRLYQERVAADKFVVFLADPDRNLVAELGRERRSTAAGAIYRSIIRTEEHGGWVDRTWLAWTIRSARSELAAIGRNSRALAGLLMILAVLGTFAGMRDAVPDLSLAIQNVTRSEPTGPSESRPDGIGSGQEVRAALDDVSAAFGANFLALFGAVVLGIAAHGATTERNKLVRELAMATESRVASSAGGSASGADLADAIRAMTASAQSVEGMRGSIDGLNTMLRGFRADLRQSLEDLGSNVSRSIQVSLEHQMVETLDRTSRGVEDVAKALASTTVAYEGLIEDQANSRQALEDGIRTLEEASRQTAMVFEAGTSSMDRSLDRVGQQVDEVGRSLMSGLDAVSAAVRKLQGATEASGASLDEGTRELRQTVKKVEDAVASQAEAITQWTDATGPYGKQFEAASTALREAGQETRDAAVKILDRLRQSELAAQGRSEKLARRLEARVVEMTEAIEEATQALTGSASETARGTREALAEAAGRLEEAVSTFTDSIKDLNRDREHLLKRDPVRVDLTARSIEQLKHSRRGGLFGLFRRG